MRLPMLNRRKQGVVLCLLAAMMTAVLVQVYQIHSYHIKHDTLRKILFDKKNNLISSGGKTLLLNYSTRTSHPATPQTHKDSTNRVHGVQKEYAGELTPNFHTNITKECKPLVDPSNIYTPFKFYIYDLPPKFNTAIRERMSTHREYAFCYNLNYCGTGEELYKYNYNGSNFYQNKERKTMLANDQNYITSVRNSHMFALEVVIHYKLMHSPYRTLDPSKADIFYIPAYTGLTCLSDYSGADSFVQELFAYLRASNSYYLSGKPHFSTLSKIQREQGSSHCTTLRHPDTAKITYITIEKESNPNWSIRGNIYGNSVIVAPYPSYIHFIPKLKDSGLKEYNTNIPFLINNTHFRLSVPSLAERNIKFLLACSTRRSNYFRAKIIDQFKIKTEKSYEHFLQHNNISGNKTLIRDVMLKTPECSNSHRTTTIPWMHHSVFCLQPPGDSPTRKSFYDSILSGCIPVIFSLKYKTEYPFEKWLDYSKFTVTLDEKLVSRYEQTVVEIVEGIPQNKVEMLHENLLTVAQWFQYSMTDGNIQQDNDAVTLILQQLREIYKL